MARVKPNPTNSTSVQFLLDLKTLGYENMTVGAMLRELQTNSKAQRNVDAKFASHQYKDLKFVQMYKNDAILNLTGLPLQILTIMAMYSSQEGLIQIKVADIGALIGITNKKRVSTAIKALVDGGYISRRAEPARHEAPIYMINPRLYYKGSPIFIKRQESQYSKLTNGQSRIAPTSEYEPIETSVKKELDDGTKVSYINLSVKKRSPQDNSNSPGDFGQPQHNDITTINPEATLDLGGV